MRRTPESGSNIDSSRAAGGVATFTTSTGAPTVEEQLEKGLREVGASPVHLAVRGTAGADTVRCAWRGIARTTAQRENAIRFWLRRGTGEAIPDAAYLEAFFTAFLDTLNPEFRETAKSNFLAIAQGGLSEEYLFLTCFADYTVSDYLLGAGPTTVTVAYDRRDETRSYELYRREHEAGTYGSDALQARGEYEASLQSIVVDAEEALAAEIGGKDRIVFLAPMGAHHVIAFEAWQAVAHWDVVTETDGTVNAVRVEAPEGDPEHTQTLADLETRITTAAASDAHAGSRIANVSGLQGFYQTIGAYDDITPDDGQTTTFTPAQPPAAPTCTNGTAVGTPNANRGLVRDCETLLAAKDALRGAAALDWSTGTAVSGWEGITTGGAPSRVTGLDLSSKSLTGTIPAGLGHLFALTTLDLSHNQLAGDIPAELGWLPNLTELRLSGNQLTGCIPVALRDVATNDLSALGLLYCAPPAPGNLSAGTPDELSVVLSWDAVADAGAYRVEYRTGPDAWTTASDAITGTTHTVDTLTCGTSYDFRVSAQGSGTTYSPAWSEPSAVVVAATTPCTPPAFVGLPYAFAVSEIAGVTTAVGTVTATDVYGNALTYAITGGNADGAFAIDAASGAITVAGPLDYETTPSYALTVRVREEDRGEATAAVTITVTDVVIDYDADGDRLLEVTTLAQLHAMRWDLDGDGTSTDPTGYGLAFPDAPADMGCPSSGCTGYELMADLDFDTDGSGTVDAGDAYWNGGDGWEPIGSQASPFTATFDGNGHVIANLQIDRGGADHVGLFGFTSRSSGVRRVGLTNVDVAGNAYVGGLAGRIDGPTRASYAWGRVSGSSHTVGGLMGWSDGPIHASYANVAVTGSHYVGGLVGATTSTITASYAGGSVSAKSSGEVGGLVGWNLGAITASYAWGAVTGSDAVGGLVGSNESLGTATASYWDTTTSGQSASAGGVGHTTGELQTPTGYRGIYANWNVDIDGDGSADDPWHFGTASQYPVLQVDVDGDGTASWSELGPQYPNQAPEFVETPPITREVAENTAAGEPIGAPVTAQDDDGDTLAYTLGGADAAVFAVDAGTGQLRTSALLDYETQGAYAVTVEVDDGNGGRASVGVTITVTNVADTPPEAPQNVLATPAETSVELAWDPVAGAALYHVEYRATATPPEPWATADDMVAAPTFTVDVLDCETAHEFRVSAFGDGLAHTEAWGDPSTVVTTTTTTCLLLFDAAPYAFTIGESAAIGDPVGDRPITATDPQGGTVSYAIEAGNAGGAFALHAATGALTLAAALDFVAEHEYSLTVRATSTAGGSRDVDVAIAVQGVDCADGNVIVDPANDKALVADCRVLLAMQEILEGSDAEVQGGGLLNWGDPLRLSQWEGVTASGTPSRVTGLDLSNKLLGGGVPAELSQLTALTTLDLSANRLTEAIPAELSALTHLTTLGLSGNDLSGCIPNVLRALATAMVAAGGTHDLAQLPQDYCDETPPPAPVELAATATTATSVTLAWVGAPDVGTLTYRVQYRIPDPTDPNAPWTEDANDISGASHVVDDLTCGTEHQFQVGAYGDGVARAAAWGPWSTTLAAATAACPLAFDEKSYSFPVKATAGVGTPVGTVSAMPTSGGTVSYAIAAGNTGGAFALAGQTGELTVAGALDPAGYTLTLRATETGGGTATVAVTITVTPVAVSFGAATYTVAESDDATTTGVVENEVEVTVTLSVDPAREVVIPLTVTAQDGASGADYAGVPADLTFASGDTAQSFTFSATHDTEDDDGESVQLGFGPLPSGISAGAIPESVVSLVDDDVPEVTVGFGAAAHAVVEGERVTVTVSLSADPERDVTVPLTVTEQGGATSADYSGVPAGVTFNAGTTSATFDVAAIADTDAEDGESIRLAFGPLPPGVSAGGTTETVVSLSDPLTPVTVSFGAATYAATEGGSVTVTVSLDADPGREVTIPLTVTEQGGATSADYSGVPADVTFSAGVTSTTFDVTATQDTEDDDGESVKLGFGTLPPAVSAGATSETVVSLTDDDVPQVTVSFAAATYGVAEGETVTVTVSLDADPEREVTIPLTVTEQGGATSADYMGVPADVTFTAGVTSTTFDVAATQDTENDDGESVKLAFGTLPPGVSGGATVETVVSLADDDVPQVTVSFGAGTYAATEGETVTVTVTLDADPERAVTVPLTVTEQGGATGADYSGVPADVTFGAGVTSTTFDVAATQDPEDDDGESVRLAFGPLPPGVSGGATIETVVSLADDDVPQVTVSFGAATYDVAEGETVTVTVSLSADPERAVTVPLTVTEQGGATSADYAGVPAEVTFGAGTTSVTFDVMAEDDAADDDGESLALGFGGLPAGVTAGATATTTVNLADTDGPPPVWTATLTVGRYNALLGFQRIGETTTGALSDEAFDWEGRTLRVTDVGYHQAAGLIVIMSGGESVAGLTLQVDDVALAVADAEVFGGPTLRWPGVTLDWTEGQTVQLRLIPSPGNGT